MLRHFNLVDRRQGALFVILTICTLSLLWSGSATAVGVRPLVIDMDLKPGETREFEIKLTPSDMEELVLLNLYKPVQLLDGSLTFEQPDNLSFSALNWISLEKSQVRVYPGEEAKVKGVVRVPFSAGGSHPVIVMVEPMVQEAKTGITFRVRYAIKLNIRVERPGLRPTAELVEFVLFANEDGKPVVKGRFENTSAWDYLVSGEVTIRDRERRLVERISLGTDANAKDAIRLYPGSKVEFHGEVTRRLEPGDYQVRAFFRYGDNGQIVKNETVRVEPGQFNYPNGDDIEAFIVEPRNIDLILKPGEHKSQVVEIQSEIGESAEIELSLAGVMPDYPYSLLDWVQLRTGNRFKLSGRNKSRFALTLAVPRDAKDASYHGNLIIKAFSKNGDLINETTTPMSVLVGDEHEQSVVVRSLGGQNVEGEGFYLTLDLFNDGNTSITPKASLIIHNEQGEFVARSTLAMAETVNSLLPLHTQILEGICAELQPGSYSVEIGIEHEAKQLLVTQRLLEVK